MLCSSVAAQTTQAPNAKALNSRGYRLYKSRKYAQALALFRQATQTDPSFALGWYNLAATLSLMRKHNRTCEFDAYKRNVTEALTKAVELDTGRKARMQQDADLDPVRDTIAYQTLLGVSPATASGLSRLLQNVSWFGPAPGAFGNAYGLKFNPRGAATFWELQMNEADEPVRKPYQAKWRIGGGNEIVVELPARGDKPEQTLHGKFEGKEIVFEGAELRLSDQPSECEA